MKKMCIILIVIGILLLGLLNVVYNEFSLSEDSEAPSNEDYEVAKNDFFTYALKNSSVEILNYTWDGSTEGLMIEIPDTLDGRPVTSLGGDRESSNSPFIINSEALHSEYKEEIVYVDYTLKIGPNIESVYAVGDDPETFIIDGAAIEIVNRVYVECDPENKYFYSENGILYKKNGEKVEDFWYQE